MNISRLGVGLLAALIIFASAAAVFGNRYMPRYSTFNAPKVVAAAARIRVNGSQARPLPPLIRLSGEVIELAAGAPLTVTATVGGSTFPATVSGNTYTVAIGRPGSEQMVTVEARSTRVHYRTVVGSAGQLRALAGSDSLLTLSEQPTLRVSPYSTALSWLVRYALGDRDANSDAEFETTTRVAASSNLEHAAYVLAGFAKNELYIPDGFAGYVDGYQLLRDRDAFSQFINYGARELSAGYLFAQSHEQLLASAEAMPEQWAFVNGMPREQLPILVGEVFLLSRRGDGNFDFNERTPLWDPINAVALDALGRLQFTPVGNQVRIIQKFVDVGGGQMVSRPVERTAAGRTLKRLTRGDTTAIWTMRSVWHDKEQGNPGAPVVEEVEYQVLSSTSLGAWAAPDGWSSVAASTIALPWLCGSSASPEEQIYDFSRCEYVEHRFEQGGGGGTVDHGWKVDPQTMVPKTPRTQPFTWLIGAQGALDLTDGNVATTFWRLRGYPLDIGPVFYRSRSLSGVWSGKTMVGIDMAANKSMISWPASATIGNWRFDSPDYLSYWYTTTNYESLVDRNTGGVGQETFATNNPTPIWWQAAGNAVYDTRIRVWYYGVPPSPPYTETCQAGFANGGYGCFTRVRYFKPIARVDNGYYGIGDTYTRDFYPEDPAQGTPEESWNQHVISALVYYDCTGGACASAVASSRPGLRGNHATDKGVRPATRSLTWPRGQRVPSQLE